MTEEEICHLDKVVSPLIKKGQSISHIHKTNDLACTRGTLYNYISRNCFSACSIDLPRKVKMRKCKQKRAEPKDTVVRLNRTYEEY